MIRGGEELLSAAPLIPVRPSLERLRSAAKSCRACPLWKTGTQTVFGEGSPEAKVMFVGEQPGNDAVEAGGELSRRRAVADQPDRERLVDSERFAEQQVSGGKAPAREPRDQQRARGFRHQA